MPEELGKVQVAVEFDVKAARQKLKKDSEQSGTEAGRATALAWVKEYERRFELDIAKIKEHQQRGLLSPKEAAKAGADAAREYNAAMIRVIDEGARAGAFRGRAGQDALGAISGSIKDVEVAGRRAGLGLGRLNDSMVQVFRQASGANPIMGRLVDTVGTFAIGTGMMVPVLAGLAAIAYGWTAITKEAREAKTALQSALERLGLLRERQRADAAGPGGQSVLDLDQAKAERDRLQAEISELEAKRAAFEPTALTSESSAMVVASVDRDLAELRKAYDDMQRTVEAGERDVAEAWERASKEARQRDIANLAAVISANEATEAELERGRRIVARNQELLRRLAEGDQTSEVLARKAEALAENRQLVAALADDPKIAQALERAKKEAEEATERLQRLAAVQRELAAAGVGEEGTFSTASTTKLVQDIVKLQGEIAQAKADLALVGESLAPENLAAAQAGVAALEDQLAKLRQQAADSVVEIGEVTSRLVESGRSVIDTLLQFDDGSFRFARDAMGEVMQFVRDVTEAEKELELARMSQDPERLKAAEEGLSDARKRGADAVAGLLSAVESSNLSVADQTRLIEALRDAYAALGIEVKKTDEGLGFFAKHADEMQTLARGVLSVADSMGILSDRARRAVTGLLDVLDGLKSIEKAKAATGAASLLGLAGGGIAIAGGLIAAGSALFGGGEDREALMQANTEALADLKRSIDEWGERVRGLSSEDRARYQGAIDRWPTSFRELDPQTMTRTAGGWGDPSLYGGALRDKAAIDDLVEFLGFDFGENIDAHEWEMLLEAWNEALAEAKAQVEEVRSGKIGEYDAYLSDDPQAMQRFRADQSRDQDLAWAAANKDLMTDAEYEEFTRKVWDVWQKTIDTLDDAAERAQVELDRRREGVQADIDARRAALNGDDRGAFEIRTRAHAAEQKQIAQDLFDSGVITQQMFEELVQLIDDEVLQSLADFDQAVADAANAANEEAAAQKKANKKTHDDFITDFTQRRAGLAGDDQLAFQIGLQADLDQQLAAAQELLDAGIISKQEFEDFAQLLSGEFADAMATAKQATLDFVTSMQQDLAIRKLLVEGRDREAAVMQLQIRHHQQMAEAIAAGMSDDFLTELRDVQRREMLKLNDDWDERERQRQDDAFVERNSDVGRSRGDKGGGRGASDNFHAVKSITFYQAHTLTDIAQAQLYVLRSIDAKVGGLRGFNPLASVPLPPSMQTSAAPASGATVRFGDLYLNVQAPAGADPREFGRAISAAVMDEIETELGSRLAAYDRGRGRTRIS